MHPAVQQLIQCIDLEEKAQVERYSLDQVHTLRSLKAEGLALHPIIVTRKSFGYADYPEISFRLAFPAETNLFRDGAAIECFKTGEDPVKGILLSLEARTGEFRLFAPDYPDWIEDDGVGIKLAPDTRTTGVMKKVLKELENNPALFKLFEQLHGKPVAGNEPISSPTTTPVYYNQFLNESQKQAVLAATQDTQCTIIHGPPGTGKTTTLAEAIIQLVGAGKKILLTAPSNTAVDNISRRLIDAGIHLLRVGNASKVDAAIFAHTPEGKLNNSKAQKELKALKMRAEEFRRMALKYKRSFGKAEREQRNLLFKEVKSIRNEIRQLQAYNEEKLFQEAQVIAGTPIGLYDAGVDHIYFDTLVMDEAGQCLEPLAWCVFPLAKNIVLAGDHWQLPPTVISQEAIRKGFNRSILELAVPASDRVFLLDIQYRMREMIAGFSSQYFYKGLLHTATHLANAGVHISFIDTAGSGFQEMHGSGGTSLQNEGELKILSQVLETLSHEPSAIAFISPYAGQVAAAKEKFPNLRASTIDSFQGQEKQCILLSLVRSNDDGDIGFLKDYRRMNVALTRAKEELIIIGDSATIGGDPFYKAFLEYVEAHGNYRSVWEFEL